ncbi:MULTISPECIES: hypothetical protein [unclassified Caballeronia]|uniref:hypothetical protein n=1 Tax=unclassified Caballeronia TaxID=2646786 RepID=UPI0028592403|nr:MULTISPECIES: hypothetical protein [unclassified Caballeronia]MDR5750604.1 hypothetical protein [Caballeronia sp. LZ024]MDR5842363.1 hypothetical protein [Caballeronia sp. LZ031]
MKGARQRVPVRPERIIKKTLLASALYGALTMPPVAAPVYAQTSWNSTRDAAVSDRTVTAPPNRYDARIIRAHQNSGKKQAGGRNSDPQGSASMQTIQQTDPPARPPRHAVMTADERRLLRQHIEEAVRDLYKR